MTTPHTKARFLSMLEAGHQQMAAFSYEHTRLEYLADYIFNFTTYDGEVAEQWAKFAIAVCKAITEQQTHEFIKENQENYQAYLVMCNMPFFEKHITWGTSVRGAWWDTGSHLIETVGLWDAEDQFSEARVTREEWLMYIAAIVEFGEKA